MGERGGGRVNANGRPPFYRSEYAPIYGDVVRKGRFEGWAEIVERDAQRWDPTDGKPNPFVFATIRFLADPPDKTEGRLIWFSDIRPEPPPLEQIA